LQLWLLIKESPAPDVTNNMKAAISFNATRHHSIVNSAIGLIGAVAWRFVLAIGIARAI
jgi:hypothetical protein